MSKTTPLPCLRSFKRLVSTRARVAEEVQDTRRLAKTVRRPLPTALGSASQDPHYVVQLRLCSVVVFQRLI
jgi:hypothetical protein